MRVLLVVPVARARGSPRPVGLYDSRTDREQKILPPYIRVRPKIYAGHEPRTNVRTKQQLIGMISKKCSSFVVLPIHLSVNCVFW